MSEDLREMRVVVSVCMLCWCVCVVWCGVCVCVLFVCNVCVCVSVRTSARQ